MADSYGTWAYFMLYPAADGDGRPIDHAHVMPWWLVEKILKRHRSQ